MGVIAINESIHGELRQPPLTSNTPNVRHFFFVFMISSNKGNCNELMTYIQICQCYFSPPSSTFYLRITRFWFLFIHTSGTKVAKTVFITC